MSIRCSQKTIFLQIKKMLGFLFSQFLGFSVSLPNVNFMSSGRYWFHMQDFQDLIRQIFIMFGACLLQKKKRHFRFAFFEIYKNSSC